MHFWHFSRLYIWKLGCNSCSFMISPNYLALDVIVGDCPGQNKKENHFYGPHLDHKFKGQKDAYSVCLSLVLFSQHETQYASADASVAVFVSWARQCISSAKEEPTMNPAVLGCIAGSTLVRKAASRAFEKKRRSTLTGDIIECLGSRYAPDHP